jgi:hypothetical protein
MNSYVVIPDDQREEKLKQLIIVLHNLRYWTKYWKIHLGGPAKAKKEYWEERADTLLTELGLKQHMSIRSSFIARQ